MLVNITRDQFVSSITEDKADKFAKTFVSKADMGGYWDKCFGLLNDEGDLMGAIITTISKRKPHVANLQLLHTFAKHRRKGVARKLCEHSLQYSKKNFAKYFRVSSEKGAIPFYQSLGMVMLGVQKSGCQLSMCRIQGDSFSECSYDITDLVIHKAVYKKGKGGCVDILVEENAEINVYFQ